MVLLLNMLPFLIALIGVGLSIYTRNIWVFLGTALILVLYMKIQPSYMPKGTVERSYVPEFQVVDKPITNRMLKAKPGLERDKDRNEQYKETDERLKHLIEQERAAKN